MNDTQTPELVKAQCRSKTPTWERTFQVPTKRRLGFYLAVHLYHNSRTRPKTALEVAVEEVGLFTCTLMLRPIFNMKL